MDIAQVVSVPQADIIGTIVNILNILISYSDEFVIFFQTILSSLFIISIPLCLMIFIGTVYANHNLKIIREKEESVYDKPIEQAYQSVARPEQGMAERWKQVMVHVDSENPNDWRQAIMEADIILESILDTMGYQGESIGEMLKRVEKGDMENLDNAWEAHKVRNAIAHQGSQFELTKHEARRVINLYRKVFEEFYYI